MGNNRNLPVPFQNNAGIGNNVNLESLFGSAGSLLSGLFGGSGDPYKQAMEQYQKWANEAKNVQNPYLNAGQGAIPDYQKWLESQKDPSKFINDIMGQYGESPWARYEQQQSMRAGENAASALGLLGSTPFAQQMQQNAMNISSQDMQNWLNNVLGINAQYGQGQQNMMGIGANAANALTNMYANLGQQMGEAAYGQKAGQNQDFGNSLAGALGMIGSLFGL